MAALLRTLEGDRDPGPVLPRHVPAHHPGGRGRPGRTARSRTRTGWPRWDVDFAGLYLDALEAHRADPAQVAAAVAAGLRREARPAARGARPARHERAHQLRPAAVAGPRDPGGGLRRSRAGWRCAAATTSGSTTSWPAGSPRRTTPCSGPAAAAPGWTALLTPANRTREPAVPAGVPAEGVGQHRRAARGAGARPGRLRRTARRPRGAPAPRGCATCCGRGPSCCAWPSAASG